MTDKKFSHIHTHKSHDGVEYSHSHDDIHEHEYGHTGGHGHNHSHQNTKTVLNRLSRASGHLEAVKRMVEDGKDCTEVLIQLSAVIAALKSTGKVILADHIANCIVDAVESGDNKAIENLNIAIDRFMK
jgi:DNA-binding FrmR family transcriptional regulator